MSSMNFREAQARNIRNTVLLIGAFVVLCVTLGFVFGFAIGGRPETGVVGVVIGASFGGIMALVAIYGGAQTVLFAAGAREIQAAQTIEERVLVNVVEEMALASGLPMPRVFVIEDASPNAFAAGRTPKEAVVAVTRGLLNSLNREELQGVIAHEMGHVRNYDILYTVVVAVMVGLVVILSDFFMRSLWFGAPRRSSNEHAGLQIIFLIVGIVLAIIAPLLAQLMFFAVSRQREYLADATAAELTRNPLGLAKALEKIAGSPHRLSNANRGTAHLYIINPLASYGRNRDAFATHPPTQERIDRLRKMAHDYAG